MKTFFQDNGIEVSYEARMPMEHEQGKFNQVLEEIKTNARSKYSSTVLSWVTLQKIAMKSFLVMYKLFQNRAKGTRGRQRRFIIVTALMDGTYNHGAFAVYLSKWC